ncbi:MAG TPA: hypothetical protein VG797_02240 [Phycisphaerales bacterium]|nr:hypothetical protein [Phycisphaerales bacterium]
MPRSTLDILYHKLWSRTWDLAHSVGLGFKPAGVFRHIYKNRTWGDRESVSGPGSELAETHAVRAILPPLLKELGVTSILDAPCGDFNWMKHVDLTNIHYIGADVVPELIAENTRRYAKDSAPSPSGRGRGEGFLPSTPSPHATTGGSEPTGVSAPSPSGRGQGEGFVSSTQSPRATTGGGSEPTVVPTRPSSLRFLTLDITRDQLPKVDLILCRDCLVHLSNKMVSAALNNFKSSGAKYLLTTTYPGAVQGENRDIATGQFRMVDLTLPPFNMPKPERLINEQSAEGGLHKSLGLWSLVDQL